MSSGVTVTCCVFGENYIEVDREISNVFSSDLCVLVNLPLHNKMSVSHVDANRWNKYRRKLSPYLRRGKRMLCQGGSYRATCTHTSPQLYIVYTVFIVLLNSSVFRAKTSTTEETEGVAGSFGALQLPFLSPHDVLQPQLF